MFVTQSFVGKSCPCESESVVHSDYFAAVPNSCNCRPRGHQVPNFARHIFGWALQTFKQPVSPFYRSETLEDAW